MKINDIIENATYVQFPKLDQTYRLYSSLEGKNIIKLPTTDMLYKTWKMNEHHYTTQYHREIVYPIWAELFGFEYDPNNYHLIKKESDEYDISMLVPNKEYNFDVECFDRNETMSNVSYEKLINGTVGPTDYHSLYLYPHMCSKIVNNTIDNNRKLFISADSQMIPSIAFLAQHFKETYHFDNRTTKSFKDIIESVDYTNILFALWDSSIDRYVNYNLNGIPCNEDEPNKKITTNNKIKSKHAVREHDLPAHKMFRS